jgi:hypothetical protein
MKFPVQRGWKESRHEARRFLWHLSKKRFSHQHWWGKEHAKQTPEAALWESMRRHPDVECIRRHPARRCIDDLRRLSKDGADNPSNLAWYVGCRASRCWPELREEEKMEFSERLWAVSSRFRTFCTPPGILLTEDDMLLLDYGDLRRQQRLPIAVDLSGDPASVARWVEQVVKEHGKGLE